MSRQILIAGDSTVTNRVSTRENEADNCCTGWGQMLPLYLGTEYKVKNFAKSGLTTDTFREEGYYNLLLSELKSDDFVLFQFGHNDQKRPELQCNGRYKENLITYINEIREKKAIPIIVTPLARNSWNCSTSKYNDLLLDYSKSAKQVCEETDTLLIDLHDISKKWIIETGRENAKKYFYPGDFTHTNDYGAFKIAGFVYEILKDMIKPMETKTVWTDICPSKIPQFLYEDPKNNLTRVDALRVVRELCAFFAKNEESPADTNIEIIAARQNGYLLFEDKLDENITEKDFITLLKLTTSGREIIPDDLFSESDNLKETITKEKALKYIEIYEDKLNYRKDKKKLEIAGS